MDRIGDWMQTHTGRRFWPVDPRPEDVCIEDIAHALSNMCRYGGHCSEFYSVAQHSVLVSRNLPNRYKLWGLLHDASEAYIVDVPRPLKYSLEDYKKAENKVMSCIVRAFNLYPHEIPLSVKAIDDYILGDEMRSLMKSPIITCLLQPSLGINIEPWSPSTAKRIFLEEFNEVRYLDEASY